MTKGKEEMVNFILVNAFFPYMAILGWPWIHTVGAVLSTLHMKIKFPIEDGIALFRVDQQVAKQCLVVAINHEIKQIELAELDSL